ncbi:MAG: helix-turn-helix transcriptional regulator [Bacteroidia bacterium]
MYKTVLTISISGLEKDAISFNEIEVRIFYCLSQGLSNKQIKEIENLSVGAIKKHLTKMYEKTKLKIHSETALVGWLAEHDVYNKIKEKIEQTDLIEKVERLRQISSY